MVSSDGESATQWQDWLQDEHADQAGDYERNDEMSVRRDMLAEALSVLNDREKDIITQRRLHDQPVTLEELSSQYDVSRERIRQIEVRAFEKLQNRMRELAQKKGLLRDL
jgi:RNA polymerase sigma-32 factor